MKPSQYSVIIPQNCGVKLRSKKESILVIKEKLNQLILEGKGQSFMAKAYRNILERSLENP